MSKIKGTKSNMLNKEQKLKIVMEHIEKGLTFSELSKKYNISYSSIRKWSYDFDLMGYNSLENNTGKNNYFRKNSINPKDREIAKLKKELKEERLKNEILEKFDLFLKEKQKK